MSCEYVRDYYNVPACIGRKVIVNGRPGIISEDMGHYIGVLFDDDNPGPALPAHPTWEVEYGEMGKVREVKMTRSKQRYQDYLNSCHAEAGMSFAEYMGFET